MKQAQLQNLCCVVPCYNVASTCERVIAELKGFVHNVIAVDDGSNDGTAEALKRTDAVILSHGQNRGKGSALITGFKEALKLSHVEGILTIDSDAQHDPSDVRILAKAMPCDIVVGHRFSKRVKNQPIIRRFSNGFSNRILSLLCGQPILDGQSGFRIYSRRFAEYMVEHSKGGRFEWETEALLIAARRGFAIKFIPIKGHYPEKDFRSSFRSFRDSARIVMVMLADLLK